MMMNPVCLCICISLTFIVYWYKTLIFLLIAILLNQNSCSYRDNRGETLMKYEHWDLQSDETYINNAIEAWYSTGAKYSADDPSAALDYTQVFLMIF